MPTEFPREDALPAERTDDAAPGVFATDALSEDDLDLIDLRYDQFVAQSEFDRVMLELTVS